VSQRILTKYTIKSEHVNFVSTPYDTLMMVASATESFWRLSTCNQKAFYRSAFIGSLCVIWEDVLHIFIQIFIITII